MMDRLKSYMRAVDEGSTGRYHDYRDTCKGKMTRKDYEGKHGRFRGTPKKMRVGKKELVKFLK